MQCGLKGMNTQQEGLALLRWAIAGQKALGKAQGKHREFLYQGPHVQMHCSNNPCAVKGVWCNQANTLSEGQKLNFPSVP